MQKFEVQTRFTSGWENCWKDNGKPVTFDTVEAANDELAKYITDSRAAVKDGDVTSFNPDDYRVAKVGLNGSF